jgi:hypothetical protein
MSIDGCSIQIFLNERINKKGDLKMEIEPVKITLTYTNGKKEEVHVSEDHAFFFLESLNSQRPFVDLWMDDDELVSIRKEDIALAKVKGIEYDDVVYEDLHENISDSVLQVAKSLDGFTEMMNDYLQSKKRY